jgi:hypothetical protein
MTDTTTTTPTELVDAYFELWLATDADARRALVEQTFVPDGRHVDPHADAVGHDGVVEMLEGIHAAYPGFTIERTTGIDAHGDQLRYGWQMASADRSLVIDGVDVAERAPDGRFLKVAGFWGDLPPA